MGNSKVIGSQIFNRTGLTGVIGVRVDPLFRLKVDIILRQMHCMLVVVDAAETSNWLCASISLLQD